MRFNDTLDKKYLAERHILCFEDVYFFQLLFYILLTLDGGLNKLVMTGKC